MPLSAMWKMRKGPVKAKLYAVRFRWYGLFPVELRVYAYDSAGAKDILRDMTHATASEIEEPEEL